MHGVDAVLKGDPPLGHHGQEGEVALGLLEQGGGEVGQFVGVFRGQNGRALQGGGFRHDQIVARFQAGQLPIPGHPGHYRSTGDGPGHGIGELRVPAQNVHPSHSGRRGEIVRDMADIFRGIVGGQQQRHQQAHGLRAHADGVVAVHVDAEEAQALVPGGGDGVHAEHDQVSAEVQRGAVLTHTGHGQGLRADALEFR